MFLFLLPSSLAGFLGMQQTGASSESAVTVKAPGCFLEIPGQSLLFLALAGIVKRQSHQSHPGVVYHETTVHSVNGGGWRHLWSVVWVLRIISPYLHTASNAFYYFLHKCSKHILLYFLQELLYKYLFYSQQ